MFNRAASNPKNKPDEIFIECFEIEAKAGGC
jgi:hypothetical protein